MSKGSYFSTVSYTENPKEYNRQWYIRNREKRLKDVLIYKRNNREKVLTCKRKDSRRYLLEKRYGLTVEQFDQKLIYQDNICAICSREFKNSKDKCIDHCHHTGKIRQILCFNCNIGIGKFQDSVEMLEKALAYLRKHHEI